ncbi:MAG: DedA family protein [Polyangiaceae bacterium]|nr:DedA family protein [Polyangiaceae bacterium]
MDTLSLIFNTAIWLFDYVLHFNVHLGELVDRYGLWIYALLFLVVFCETGLVVTPFLPGDSLLFAAGTIAAAGQMNLFVLCLVLYVAAVLGDTVNYSVGHWGGRELAKKYPRLIREKHIKKTERFFERYGGKTIVIARFVPIVRTFAPFVAGIGKMKYSRFMSFNASGGFLWVFLLVPAGYFFANVKIVKENFSIVIFTIIILSLLPAVVEIIREWHRDRKEKKHIAILAAATPAGSAAQTAGDVQSDVQSDDQSPNQEPGSSVSAP